MGGDLHGAKSSSGDSNSDDDKGFGERVAVALPPRADYHDVKDQVEHLPLLMQYETLQQLKEVKKTNNRRQWTSFGRHDQEGYSNLQIQNYLKNTQINSHIERVRSQLAGTHVLTTDDGRTVPAKRIISDASTEYVLYRTAQGDDEAAAEKTKVERGAQAYLSRLGDESLVDREGSCVGSGTHTISMRKTAVAAVNGGKGAKEESQTEEESEEWESDAPPAAAAGREQEGAALGVFQAVFESLPPPDADSDSEIFMPNAAAPPQEAEPAPQETGGSESDEMEEVVVERERGEASADEATRTSPQGRTTGSPPGRTTVLPQGRTVISPQGGLQGRPGASASPKDGEVSRSAAKAKGTPRASSSGGRGRVRWGLDEDEALARRLQAQENGRLRASGAHLGSDDVEVMVVDAPASPAVDPYSLPEHIQLEIALKQSLNPAGGSLNADEDELSDEVQMTLAVQASLAGQACSGGSSSREAGSSSRQDVPSAHDLAQNGWSSSKSVASGKLKPLDLAQSGGSSSKSVPAGPRVAQGGQGELPNKGKNPVFPSQKRGSEAQKHEELANKEKKPESGASPASGGSEPQRHVELPNGKEKVIHSQGFSSEAGGEGNGKEKASQSQGGSSSGRKAEVPNQGKNPVRGAQPIDWEDDGGGGFFPEDGDDVGDGGGDVLIVGTSKDRVCQAEEEVETCSRCGVKGDIGMLTCKTCTFSVHSWCLYARGSEEEDAAIDLGEIWVCKRCAGRAAGAEAGKDAADEKLAKSLQCEEYESGGYEPPVSQAGGSRGDAGDEAPAGKPKTARQIVQELGYDLTGGVLSKARPKKLYAEDAGSRTRVVNKANRESALGGAEDEEEDGWSGRVRGAGAEETDRLLGMLESENRSLTADRNRQAAQAEGVTEGMMDDVQEMLDLFGVPYVLSPTEAESQCAMLEQLKLVDGIVTDDADVFLFGGRNVFKNIFSDKKYLEWYMMETIESELFLKRRDLISLALLLGSDYTEGVRGIGPVNAFEILRAFQGDLAEFRAWVYTPSDKYDHTRGTGGDDSLVALRKDFAKKHAGAKKKWAVSTEFPSDAVVEAYVNPIVDKSSESFEWGEPDVPGLVVFCERKLDWSGEFTMAQLKPAVEAYRSRTVQTRIDQFADFYSRAARVKSVRIQRALQQLKGVVPDDMFVDSATNAPKAAKKRKGGGGREGGEKKKRARKEPAHKASPEEEMVEEMVQARPLVPKEQECVEADDEGEDEWETQDDDEEYQQALALSLEFGAISTGALPPAGGATSSSAAGVSVEAVDEASLSRYERERDQRVRGNLEVMSRLGIIEAAAAMVASPKVFGSGKKAAREERRETPKRKSAGREGRSYREASSSSSEGDDGDDARKAGIDIEMPRLTKGCSSELEDKDGMKKRSSGKKRRRRAEGATEAREHDTSPEQLGVATGHAGAIGEDAGGSEFDRAQAQSMERGPQDTASEAQGNEGESDEEFKIAMALSMEEGHP